MEEIKYIIKFLKEREFADTILLENCFYANPAGYYWEKDDGQGDSKEASAIYRALKECNRGICVKDIKNHAGSPIFCCYCVSSVDICDGYIENIDKRCVEDFLGNDGCMVIISYIEFLKMLRSCKEVIIHGAVTYKDSLSYEEESRFLKGKSYEALFNKRERFKYQKEYRVVFSGEIIGSLCAVGDGVKIIYPKSGDKYHFDYKLDEKIVYDKNNLVEMENGSYRIKLKCER